MNSSDNTERDAVDERLSHALQSLPAPETPAGMEARVNERIWQRGRTQLAGAAAGVALLFLAVVFAGPWGRKDMPIEPLPLPVAQTPREIPADDLAVLFAPPPVDSLDELARRDAVSIAALNRMGGVK